MLKAIWRTPWMRIHHKSVLVQNEPFVGINYRACPSCEAGSPYVYVHILFGWPNVAAVLSFLRLPIHGSDIISSSFFAYPSLPPQILFSRHRFCFLDRSGDLGVPIEPLQSTFQVCSSVKLLRVFLFLSISLAMIWVHRFTFAWIWASLRPPLFSSFNCFPGWFTLGFFGFDRINWIRFFAWMNLRELDVFRLDWIDSFFAFSTGKLVFCVGVSMK